MGDGGAAAGTDITERMLGILSRPNDRALAKIVTLAADLCDVEAAGITLLKEGAYHLTVAQGIEPMVCPAEDTFCTHTMTTHGVYFVEDAPADPRFSGIGWVDGRFATARFYASAPIYAPAGAMVGRLFVIGSLARGLSPLQERSLEALAGAATRTIELQLVNRAELAREPGPEDVAVMARVAAELSHDLRVPLASMRASMELLEDALAEAEPTVVMLLGRASSAADRMTRMLEQVMRFGSVDDNPKLADVDLVKPLSQLLVDSVTLLEASGTRVEVGDLPLVRANPDDMYSLLQNLLTNSVKFARPGVPCVVKVTSRRVEDRWRISFSDNGIGIPADRRRDVFTLFSRVDPSRAGHGIGLATAARIVSAHGGRFGADEAPGGGAEIWFELPAA